VELVDVDVLDVLLLLVLDVDDELLEVVVTRQAPHTLPVPAVAPPTAAQRASSRMMRARKVASGGMQHTTADGLPQVERAAHGTMPRFASVRQPPLRIMFRKRTTQRM
jgi:hypothetical protein